MSPCPPHAADPPSGDRPPGHRRRTRLPQHRPARPPRAPRLPHGQCPKTGPTAGGRSTTGFSTDLSASVSVLLIALPLSLGIALATGAPLQAGLVGAAVGGIVAGRLGGAPLLVSGPTASLTVITADLIQQYGWRTTCAITVMAGLAQIGLGLLRVAHSALVVSPAIVHGMVAGIGVTIAVAQLHVVLGGSPQSSVIDNLRELPQQLSAPHPASLSVSAVTITVLLLWPRLPGRAGRRLRVVPAALAAVAAGTATAFAAGLSVPRVDLPSWSSHALVQLPDGPVLGLIAAALTVTLVASVESLLSAVAVDKLAASRQDKGGPRVPRSDLDRELRGQGAGNVLSGALGGLPIAGVAVRSSANVAAGAVSRRSTMLHGMWVLIAAGLLIGLLELIPLPALAALVMVVGIQMVKLTHIRSVNRHRESLVYAATTLGVVLLGVLEGVLIGIAVAVTLALHRLAHTVITVDRDPLRREYGHAEGADRTVQAAHAVRTGHAAHAGPSGEVGNGHLGDEGRIGHPGSVAHQDRAPGNGGGVGHAGSSSEPGAYRVRVHGQLTFLAVPRLSRALAQVPEGSTAVVELNGSFIDHAAYETLRDWRSAYTSQGGTVEMAGRSAHGIAEPSVAHGCSPWTAWRNHQCITPGAGGAGDPEQGGSHLLDGLRYFQQRTAPRVRDELARLAREGQRPSHLFLTCADSRLVTSMITSSGPGDLFTVRNIGNLVPPPGEESADDSVAAAIEYAVDVLSVKSITVCGHSGCGAMQALHSTHAGPAPTPTPLSRWLRYGHPSLERLAGLDGRGPEIGDRLPVDEIEALCLINVVQQLEHLRSHEYVAGRLGDGSLSIHGMYFHVGEAQAYVLDGQPGTPIFVPVRADSLAI